MYGTKLERVGTNVFKLKIRSDPIQHNFEGRRSVPLQFHVLERNGTGTLNLFLKVPKHWPQHPLDMGRKDGGQKSNALAIQLDAKGKIKCDPNARQGREDKVVYSNFTRNTKLSIQEDPSLCKQCFGTFKNKFKVPVPFRSNTWN